MSDGGSDHPDLVLVEPIHEGRHFDVWRGTWRGREACAKFVAAGPRSAREPHLYGAHWSTSFSRLVSVIAESGVEVDQAPLDEVLAAEAVRIGESRGAWGHEALALVQDPSRGTGLVTPRHEGRRLDQLLRHEARRALPRLLPKLWDALAAAPHGDVSASNLVVREGGEGFVLLDPCASVAYVTGDGLDNDCRLYFTTTPAAYPLLPPWYRAGLTLAEGHALSEHLDDFLGDLSRSSRPVTVGKATEMVVVAPRRPRLGEKASPREPHPADLLALGVLYYEVLARRHPFLGEDYPRPAWLGGRTEDRHAVGFEGAQRAASRAVVAPGLHAKDVTAAEERLALALLALAVPSREALVRLSERC